MTEMSALPTIDPAELPGPARKILAAEPGSKLQLLAARGIVPGLRPDALLAVMVALLASPAEAVRAQADDSLSDLGEPVLRGALTSDLQPAVILQLAKRFIEQPSVVEPLLRMPRMPLAALEHLARGGGEAISELLATNQEQLIAEPHLIELLYMNRHTRMSTADRLIELAVRHDLDLSGLAAFREMADAIAGQLIPAASDAPLPEDDDFRETDELARSLTEHDDEQDAFDTDDEGAEELKKKFVPVLQRLAAMTISQKIRRAMLGTKEERMILVRGRNKIVATAAAKSPLMREPDVVLISRNRSVSEDVLRLVGTSPEWLKSYPIKCNLVFNSKTPIAIAQRLVNQLRESDLRKLARSRNVSSAVQLAARRHLSRRKR